jgi:hypothetical protein
MIVALHVAAGAVAELQRPDEREQPFARLSLAGAEPAAQVRPRPVQDAHTAVTRIRFDEAGTRELTAGAAFVECRGRRLEAGRSARSQPAPLALTLGIAVETALKDASW